MAGTYPLSAAHPSMAANDSPKVDERVDYLNLPCPIPYEELHHEALMSLKPDLFEGMRFGFVKILSPKFILTHSASMGATEIPTESPETIKIPTAQYEFGANFGDPKLLLVGRLMDDGRLNARGKFDLTENLTLNGSGLFTSEPSMSRGMGSLDYKGRDWRAQFQMCNGALFAACYIQSVTPNLSLGGETFWAGEHCKSGVGYGARFCTDKMVATAQVASTGMVMLSYVQKISEMISLATDFTYSYVTRESAASVGYDYIVRQSRLRGKIDSDGRVSAFMEERLGKGLKLILSGEIDHQKKDHKCGVGFTFGE